MELAYLVLCGLALFLPARFQAVAFLSAYVFVVFDPESIPAYRLSGGGTIMVGDMILVAMLARCLFFAGNRISQTVRTRGFWAPAILMVVYLITTAIGAGGFGERHLVTCIISLARSCGALMLGYILAFGLADRKSIRHSSYLVLAFVLVNACIVYFNYVGSRYGVTIGEIQGAERGEPRYFGPIGDGVGLLVALGFFVAFVRRNIWIMALFAGAIFLTGTIGAVLALGVGIAIWAVFERQLVPQLAGGGVGRLLLWLAFSGVVVGSVLLALGAGDTIRRRFQSGESVGQSFEQRQWSFGLALDLVAAHPIAGVGYQGFGDIYGTVSATGFDEAKGDVANANNQILQVLADGGIVGLVAFAWFSFEMFKLLRLAARRAGDRPLELFFAGALVWFLALLIGNQSAVWLLPGSMITMLFWVIFGHAIALLSSAEVPSNRIEKRPLVGRISRKRAMPRRVDDTKLFESP